MARKRISEFRAKNLIYPALGMVYNGIQVNSKCRLPDNLDSGKNYIVKVDQGVKGRFKKGLIKINRSYNQIPDDIKELQQKGFKQFLIEEMQSYDAAEEKYLSIERVREGYKLLYSVKGGINIEENLQTIEEKIIKDISLLPTLQGFPSDVLKKILFCFDKYYFSFLEINPFIIVNSKIIILDAAIEVDSTTEFFVNKAWTENDFTDSQKDIVEEINIKKLAAKSQAAYSLEVLNPDGALFMMLSGGGASIVLADEAANLGHGNKLANYGEYSGNPNADEVYIYAKNILTLLLKSKSKHKVLIIAGGVANFTDVRITFTGLIKALDEYKEELKAHQVKVYVRRGGPYQTEGLKQMKAYLQKSELLGVVAGPEMVLTDIVALALSHI